jgi:hypothetical protein
MKEPETNKRNEKRESRDEKQTRLMNTKLMHCDFSRGTSGQVVERKRGMKFY